MRTSAREPPILLGHLFLNWDGLKRTYIFFFNHLGRTLDLNGSSIEILLGTDDFPSRKQLCQQISYLPSVDTTVFGLENRLCPIVFQYWTHSWQI